MKEKNKENRRQNTVERGQKTVWPLAAGAAGLIVQET